MIAYLGPQTSLCTVQLTLLANTVNTCKVHKSSTNKCIRDMMLHEDNQSTIALAKNQHMHGRTNHIDIKYHFIREMVEMGKIKLAYYCPTEDMIANILMKGLLIQ